MMPSQKPYLLRAIYEWCADQGLTPYIAVVVDEHTHVPLQYVQEGQIVLNVSIDATHQLAMGNDAITFHARFGGVSQALYIPIERVAAIYAKENGQGMTFEVTDVLVPEIPVVTPESSSASEVADPPDQPPPTRPKLTRIK